MHRQSNNWIAQLKTGGKQIYLGFYAEEPLAAHAYDRALIAVQGDAAETNFPLREYADEWAHLRATPLDELVEEIKASARKGGLLAKPSQRKAKYK